MILTSVKCLLSMHSVPYTEFSAAKIRTRSQLRQRLHTHGLWELREKRQKSSQNNAIVTQQYNWIVSIKWKSI